MRFAKTAFISFAFAATSLVGVANAQQPAAPAAAPRPAPSYMVINIEGEVINKPAAEVWGAIGKYCDLGTWLRAPCAITSGKDGEVGAVRSIANGAVIEVLVSKTPLSYTYAQPLAADSYHGSMEVRPVTATTSRVVYTIFRDQSSLADQAAKDADRSRRLNQFTTAVANMKIIAEGGTLPAAPARGGGGGRGGAGGGAPAAGRGG